MRAFGVALLGSVLALLVVFGTGRALTASAAARVLSRRVAARLGRS